MSKKNQNVVLIGLMGAGKSTVGRELASYLGYSFLDTDDELERRMGVDIPTIFDVEGEVGFRKRESSVVQDMPELKNTVISTGGGAVLLEENRNHLKKAGKIVYLSATVDTLYERTKHSKKRPLLKPETVKSDLKNLLDARESIYLSLADIVVRSGDYEPKEMSKFIADKLA